MIFWWLAFLKLHIDITQISFQLFTDHYCSLHLLLDEYINYVIELLQAQAIETQYNEVLKVQRSESLTVTITSLLESRVHFQNSTSVNV